MATLSNGIISTNIQCHAVIVEPEQGKDLAIHGLVSRGGVVSVGVKDLTEIIPRAKAIMDVDNFAHDTLAEALYNYKESLK